MKRFCSTILLTVVIFASCGTYITFFVQQQIIKSQIRSLVKAEKLKQTEVFQLTEAEFEKLNTYEGGREFSLNGMMYDVVKKEQLGELIVLHAYADHREMSLIEEFSNFFSNNQKDELGKKSVTLHVFMPEFVCPDDFSSYNTEWSKIAFQHISSKIETIYIALSSPPPDILY